MAKARKEKGFILVILLSLLLLLAVTAMSLNVKSGMQVKMTANQTTNAQTYFDQLAVIEESVWQLARDPFWRTTQPSPSYPQYTRTVTNSAISSYTDTVTISVRAPNASRPVNTSFRYNIKTPFLVRKPRQVSSDSAGNIYFADMDNHSVWKIDGLGVISLVAGNGASGFSGDNGPATEAKLNSPQGVCADASGIYIADTENHRIRKVTGTTITTIAGTGTAGYGGDGGAATAAMLNSPRKVAVDTAGNLYIADSANNRIRKVTGTTITTVAGTGIAGFDSDGTVLESTSKKLNQPQGVFVDGNGDIYIADTGNQRIRKVTTWTFIFHWATFSTIAGTGAPGSTGDGGPAINATLNLPAGVAVDASGNVYIADAGNHEIRKVTGTTITTIAGTGIAGYAGDGGAATAAQIDFPTGVCVTSGKVIIADTMNSCLRKVEANNMTTWPATMTAGPGLNNPKGVAAYYDAAQKKLFLYIADSGNHRIRKLDTATNAIVTVAGTGSAGASGDDGQATAAQLNSPAAVTLDIDGNFYIADTGNNKIRKVMVASGIITTVAGISGGYIGPYLPVGDGGDAVLAQLNAPQGVSFDTARDLYIADTNNHRIRKVKTANGKISTVAGTGLAGYSGDGGNAASAQLWAPQGLFINILNDLYVADTINQSIRKISSVNTGNNIVSTVAGTGSAGYSGDGGAATAAMLSNPQRVSVDLAGNIYIADTGNHALRIVNHDTTPVISTMAGDNTINRYSGYNGDNQPAVQAWLRSPGGIALGLTKGGGRIYIGDTGNDRVRVLFLKTEQKVYGP